jgi:hypothetical protein
VQLRDVMRVQVDETRYNHQTIGGDLATIQVMDWAPVDQETAFVDVNVAVPMRPMCKHGSVEGGHGQRATEAGGAGGRPPIFASMFFVVIWRRRAYSGSLSAGIASVTPAMPMTTSTASSGPKTGAVIALTG